MSLTSEQYLQSLLRSITTYYTVQYSTDTELYNILRIYSDEFTSGSISLDVIRNNLFVVASENSKLYDNFGTYFDQDKYFDQKYNDDSYELVTGSFQKTTPALQTVQNTEIHDGWQMAASLPDNWTLAEPLENTTVFDDKFVSSCKLSIDDGSSITYYDACIYNPLNNNWIRYIPSFLQHVDVPIMGLITHQPPSSDSERLYYLALTANLFSGAADFEQILKARVVEVTSDEFDQSSGYPNLTCSVPIVYAGQHGAGEPFPPTGEITPHPQYTWTDSVVLDNKIYFGLSITEMSTTQQVTYLPSDSPDYPIYNHAPDAEYRYPFLIEYDPVTKEVDEVGLASHVSAGNDYAVSAMALHNNKLWIEVLQEVESIPLTDSDNNSDDDVATYINDFTEAADGTLYAATGDSGRLLSSTDGGDTWEEKSDFSGDPAHSDHLLSCEMFEGDLYVGTDNSYIFGGSSESTSEFFTMFTKVYDGGQPFHGPGGWNNWIIRDLLMFNSRMYAAVDYAPCSVVRSDTTGKNWECTAPSLSGSAGCYSSLSIYNGSIILGKRSGIFPLNNPPADIYKSLDGVEWESGSTAHEIFMGARDIAAFTGDSGTHLYAAAQSKLLRSASVIPGSWNEATDFADDYSMKSGTDEILTSGYINDLNVIGDYLYVSIQDHAPGYANDIYISYVFRSTSGDTGSWGDPIFQISDSTLSWLRVFNFGIYIYIMSSTGEIWRSDTGNPGSWNRVAIGKGSIQDATEAENGDIYVVSRAGAGVNYDYMNYGGAIYRSTDGGINGSFHKLVDVPDTVHALDSVESIDNTIIVSSWNTLYKLEASGGVNGGISEIESKNVESLEEFQGNLYAAGWDTAVSGSINKLSEDKTSWDTVYSSIGNGLTCLKEFNGYLYAAGYYTTVRSDQGTLWTSAINSTAGYQSVKYCLEVHGELLFGADGTKLVYTYDGTTWGLVDTFSENIASILSYYDVLYVGLVNGEIWQSFDNGENFQEAPDLYTEAAPPTLALLNGYAFCGVHKTPKGRICKWGDSGDLHHMITYNKSLGFDSVESPAGHRANLLKMYSYDGQLYAIVNNLVTKLFFVSRYDDETGLWTIHKQFIYPINTMYAHSDSTLMISLNNGDIFYLDTEDDIWMQYYPEIDDLLLSSTSGVTTFADYSSFVYAFADTAWYSSKFIFDASQYYAVPGAKLIGSATQGSSIPGYRKQLGFMLDAAMHGSTHQGVTYAANAFTLINPDIRENAPAWKLKTVSGSVEQLSANVWKFTDSPSWKDDLWKGAYGTFSSGSTIKDKIAAGYIITANDNNEITVGPIYDRNLLWDLTRFK